MNFEIQERVIREHADPFVFFRVGRLIDPATNIDLDWRSVDGMGKGFEAEIF